MCKKIFLSFCLSSLLPLSVSAQVGLVGDSIQSKNPYSAPMPIYQISIEEIKILQDCLTNILQENEKTTATLETLKHNYTLSLSTATELQTNLAQLEQKHADLLQQSQGLENHIQTLLLDLQNSNSQLTIAQDSLTELLGERDALTTAREALWTSYEQYKSEVSKTIQALQNDKIILGIVVGGAALAIGLFIGLVSH